MKKVRIITLIFFSLIVLFSCSNNDKKGEGKNSLESSEKSAWEYMLSDYSLDIDGMELHMCANLDDISKNVAELSYERTYVDMGEDYYDFGIINVKTSKNSIFQILYKDNAIHSYTIEQGNVKGDFLFDNHLKFGSTVQDMIAYLGPPMAGKHTSLMDEYGYLTIEKGYMEFVFKDDKLVKMSYGDNRNTNDVHSGAGTCELNDDNMRFDFTPLNILNNNGTVESILIDDMNITNGITEKEILMHGWKLAENDEYKFGDIYQKDGGYIEIHTGNGISFGDVNLTVNGKAILNTSINELSLGKPLSFVLPYPDARERGNLLFKHNGVYVFSIGDDGEWTLELNVDINGRIQGGYIEKSRKALDLNDFILY